MLSVQPTRGHKWVLSYRRGRRVSELGGKSVTLQGAPARAVENPTEQGTSADSSETTHSLPLPPPC